MGVTARKSPRRSARRRGGRPPAPRPGWNLRLTGLANPRPPAVTQRLATELTLSRYFAAAAIMGLLASQVEEPNEKWAREWALNFGDGMAKEARKRGI